jgi:hypothetical protein
MPFDYDQFNEDIHTKKEVNEQLKDGPSVYGGVIVDLTEIFTKRAFTVSIQQIFLTHELVRKKINSGLEKAEHALNGYVGVTTDDLIDTINVTHGTDKSQWVVAAVTLETLIEAYNNKYPFTFIKKDEQVLAYKLLCEYIDYAAELYNSRNVESDYSSKAAKIKQVRLYITIARRLIHDMHDSILKILEKDPVLKSKYPEFTQLNFLDKYILGYQDGIR